MDGRIAARNPCGEEYKDGGGEQDRRKLLHMIESTRLLQFNGFASAHVTYM
jgi:hypothetical protein